MDQKCLFYQLPMLEFGTLGTKGNTQVNIPKLYQPVYQNLGWRREERNILVVMIIIAIIIAIKVTLIMYSVKMKEVMIATITRITIMIIMIIMIIMLI